MKVKLRTPDGKVEFRLQTKAVTDFLTKGVDIPNRLIWNDQNGDEVIWIRSVQLKIQILHF